MTEIVWYCPLCQNEGTDPAVVFCANDGARVRPIATRGDAWIGRTLEGKYRVVRFIDAGGTAEVYEAERLRDGRRMALKLLHAAFADTTGALDRFQQEAQLVSRIAHPNVVEIIDFGTLPESVHFMVMELLAGKPLSLELAAGQIPVLTALRYAMQACEGLAAAHERDVIHCDIKPANLFLHRAPGGNGEVSVKILDLGIGRLFAASDAESTAVGGMIAGTPDYMSPEQAMGMPLGPATDIYAVGILLYEMLLGTVPFSDPSYSEVLAKQVKEQPVWRAEIAAARGVPSEAAAVVLRALAKNPRDRQPSMMDLQRDLAGLARVVRGRVTLGSQPTLQRMEATADPSRPVSKPRITPAAKASAARSPTEPIARPVTGPMSRPSTGPMSRATTPRPRPPTRPPGTPSLSPSSVARIDRVPLASATGHDNEVVEIAPDVYWVGRRKGAALECNAYLRVFRRGDATVAMVIDPGPPRDFEIVAAKISAVIGSIQRLDLIYLNHQDPDVASNAAAIQQASPRARVFCSEDTWRLVHFYGLDPRRAAPLERFPGGTTRLATGHEIVFVPTPFCHFRGAVMLYDPDSRVLFTGDLLGGAHGPNLIASGRRWWSGVEMFHQVYMPSSRALALAAARIRRLDPLPTILAPQHGSLIIGDSVMQAVDAIGTMPVGLDIPEPDGRDEKFVSAANDVLREYAEIAGADRARELMATYGDEGSFTNLFVCRGPQEIVGFKVAPALAVEALSNDALASLTAERRGNLQRSLRAIWKQHKLDAARNTSWPGSSTQGPEGGESS